MKIEKTTNNSWCVTAITASEINFIESLALFINAKDGYRLTDADKTASELLNSCTSDSI